jgi:hypothetical protein
VNSDQLSVKNIMKPNQECKVARGQWQGAEGLCSTRHLPLNTDD